MALNVIGYCLVNLMRSLCKRLYARWFKKRYILHHDIVALYEGTKFNLPLNYARTLTVLFVWFTYWNAFPILMYLLCIYSFWQFWMEKYMILRHYKIPLRVGTNMHSVVLKTLVYCLLIHWLYSWWFYGSPGILNNWWYDPDSTALSPKAFRARLTSRYGLTFLVLAWILFLILLFKNTWLKWKDWIQEYLKGTAVEPLGIARNFHHDKEQMEKTGIISYDIKKNPNYYKIIKSIDELHDYQIVNRRSQSSEIASK